MRRPLPLFAAAALACCVPVAMSDDATAAGAAAMPAAAPSPARAMSTMDPVVEWNQIFNDTVLGHRARAQLAGDEPFGGVAGGGGVRRGQRRRLRDPLASHHGAGTRAHIGPRGRHPGCVRDAGPSLPCASSCPCGSPECIRRGARRKRRPDQAHLIDRGLSWGQTVADTIGRRASLTGSRRRWRRSWDRRRWDTGGPPRRRTCQVPGLSSRP